MAKNIHHLMTALEAEKELGEKYFYRQRIYRVAEAGRLTEFKLRGQACYLGGHILKAFFEDLEARISKKFPNLDLSSIRIFYDMVNGKRIVVDGLFGKGISINTDEDTEDDLLKKIATINEWMQREYTEADDEEIPAEIEKHADQPVQSDQSIAKVLPEEIVWMKVDTGVIENVQIKSLILISLPSVAQFIGIRPDHFITWISTTTFKEFILSAHYKNLQGTQKEVPWKRGVISGYTPLIPFELLPEVIIAFRQSGRTVIYQEKAQLLYDVARSTLEAVGLAMSGNKNKAAEELARVGKGLGLSVADQIIGIFKQYESRDYQIQTNKEFKSKVKTIGADYAITTGKMTLGVTGRSAENWKAYGTSRRLPSSLRTSSREVMRTLSPSDGVGMTFSERHFIKDPKIDEAIETGRKGKDFYERLKQVGLLDD